jgi:hypothetical protein
MYNQFYKILIFALVGLVSLQLNAQMDIDDVEGNTGEMVAVTVRQFNIKRNGVMIPYRVTVLENRNYVTRFDKDDKGKVNQDRLDTPAMVSKMMIVRNMKDPSYDRYIVLRYKKQVTDDFELIPTSKGFAVHVDDNSLNYVDETGLYYTDTSDDDIFLVDVFDYMQ